MTENTDIAFYCPVCALPTDCFTDGILMVNGTHYHIPCSAFRSSKTSEVIRNEMKPKQEHLVKKLSELYLKQTRV